MIDFACRQFRIQDIIKCSLGLAKGDQLILDYMLKHDEKWLSTKQIAKNTALDQTTVQRLVKGLYEKKIVDRSQKNLAGGGYQFLYRVKDKPQLRAQIMSTVKGWVGGVERELSKW
jgi:predicted transcriptional regulator